MDWILWTMGYFARELMTCTWKKNVDQAYGLSWNTKGTNNNIEKLIEQHNICMKQKVL